MSSASGKVPVDTGWAWVIVAGYFVCVFHMVGTAKSFGILLDEFVDYFNVPVAVAALVMGVAGGLYTLAAPICVAAGQHFTQRKVIMLGGVVGGVGLAISGLLLSMEWVIATFGVMFGIGNACLFGNGLVLLGQYFNKRRSLANGLALSGASVGQFVLPPLFQYLLDTYSLKGTLVIIGGMYFHITMCGALFRPTSFYEKRKTEKEHEKLLRKEEKDVAGSGENGHRKPIFRKQVENPAAGDETEVLAGKHEADDITAIRFRTTSESVVMGSVDSLHSVAIETEDQSKPGMVDQNGLTKRKRNKCMSFLTGLIDFSVLKNFVVIMFVIVSFLFFFGQFNFIMFMPSAASDKGVSKYDKAYLVSISGVADLAGRILVGVAGDLHIIERYKLLASTTMLCGLSILGYALSTPYWLMGIFVGLYGFTGGCYVAINAPVLIDLVGLKAMPKVLGVVLFIQGLGAALGQPLLGAIRDKLHSYFLVNLLCFLSLVLGSVLLFTYPLFKKLEEKRNPTKSSAEQNVEIIVSS